MRIIAGVDEAGRGPLAGPVVACAVIFKTGQVFEGLADSKKLTEKKREYLFDKITNECRAYAVGECSHEEIDAINILEATMLAMQRAVAALTCSPEFVLIDGNRCPALSIPSRAIVGGDESEPVISAASIIAKVTRDRIMRQYDKQYRNYGFAKHKGYGTADHLSALSKWGPSPIHRKSFAPVAQLIEAI